MQITLPQLRPPVRLMQWELSGLRAAFQNVYVLMVQRELYDFTMRFPPELLRTLERIERSAQKLSPILNRRPFATSPCGGCLNRFVT